MSDSIVYLTDDTFEDEVINSEGPVLVDYWADWCGPCKMIAPIIEELAGEYADKGIKIAKVDIDAAPELATKFSVMNVPTLLFLKDGAEVDKLIGAQSKAEIQKRLENML